MVFGGLPFNKEWAKHGVAEATVPEAAVPLKPDLLAELKSNNYMLNALTMMSAKERGGTFGIGVDADGFLTEGCVLNVAVVSKDRILRKRPRLTRMQQRATLKDETSSLDVPGVPGLVCVL